jgi:hypothetical protein
MKKGPRFKPHPLSTPGDFYAANAACGSCGVPQVVAPELVGWTNAQHCFWLKQPDTLGELRRAMAVLETQELGCHRYAGRDREILKRISPENCDYPLKSATASIESYAISSSTQFAPLGHVSSRISKIWKRITNG